MTTPTCGTVWPTGEWGVSGVGGKGAGAGEASLKEGGSDVCVGGGKRGKAVLLSFPFLFLCYAFLFLFLWFPFAVPFLLICSFFSLLEGSLLEGKGSGCGALWL